MTNTKIAEIKGWIYRTQYSWQDEPTWGFYSYEVSGSEHVKIQEHTIAVSVPAGDMIPERVERLKAVQATILQAAHEECVKLGDEIGKLLCLTNEPSSAQAAPTTYSEEAGEYS